VLEGHERFLAPLRTGAVEIRTAEGTSWAAVSNGFADVSAESVTVLVETCELAEGIDVPRAERARAQARAALDRMGEGTSEEAERLRWQAKLARAEMRLEIAQRPQGARH
jgi:F-type H+-transporting ATPase subunit epsilon